MLLMIDFGFKKYPRIPKVETIEAAIFAKKNLNEEYIFFMYDPGIFRYVSQRKTIAGNGLIGNSEIMELSREGKFSQIIYNYKVNYIVDIFTNKEIKMIGLIPIYKSKKFQYNDEECCICIFDAIDILRTKKARRFK